MATINCLNSNFQRSQIQELINNGECFEDLISVTSELLTLQELKMILLEKLNANQKQENLALNKMYFKVLPLDLIFSDDIICSMLQYLSLPSMYHTFFVINKHFNYLMKTYSVLYQQYTIKLKFWRKLDTLYLKISHNTKSIHISYFAENTSYFPVKNIADIDSKYPFIWFCTKKLHIIPTTIFSTKIYSQNKTTTNNGGVKKILKKLISNAKSLSINDKYEELKSDKTWMNWLSLDSLFHIHSVSNDLICSDLLNHRLKYLDLTGNKTNGPHILKNKFSKLNGLMALKIDINNTFGFNFYSNQFSLITFPINLEYLEIENFNFYSENYILDLSNCKNIIAISFKQVKNRKYTLNMDANPWSFARYKPNENVNMMRNTNNLQYDLFSLCQCVEWPLNTRKGNSDYVGCILFDNSSDAQSIKSLYKYFNSFKINFETDSESNANHEMNVNVKYIRYVNKLQRQFQKTHDVHHASSIDIIINENNNNNNNNKKCVVLDWENNDGLLWKLLLMDKYESIRDSQWIQDRINFYNKWFDLDIAKWIYHLGT